MEFFALNKEQDELLKKIRTRIWRLQSGGTLDSIAAIGMDPGKQIGAGFLSLRTLAAGYEKDDKIATILWNSGQREEQIVACFLFSIELNKEKIIQLLSRVKSQEVIEYFGSVYLSTHPLLPQLLQDWSNSEESTFVLAIMTGAAKHRQIYKTEAKIDESVFVNLVTKHYDDRYIELVANRYRIDC